MFHQLQYACPEDLPTPPLQMLGISMATISEVTGLGVVSLFQRSLGGNAITVYKSL